MAGRHAASCAFTYGKTLWPAAARAGRACSHARVHSRGPALAVVDQPSAAAAGRRELSFSFPGPRKLQDITNLPLLEKEPAENIADIWTAYHDERADSLGTVIPGDALVDLQKKAKKCPMFILPLWRFGGHFMMLSQFQDTCFLLTYLEDYKVSPESAQPFATISMYEDLVESKGLGLIRADFTPNLSKKEVDKLIRLLIRFYSPLAHHHVEAFNLRPDEFDLDAMLNETPRD